MLDVSLSDLKTPSSVDEGVLFYADETQLVAILEQHLSRQNSGQQLLRCPRFIVFTDRDDLPTFDSTRLARFGEEGAADVLLVPREIRWEEIKSMYRLYRLELVIRPRIEPETIALQIRCPYEKKFSLLKGIAKEFAQRWGRMVIFCSQQEDLKRMVAEFDLCRRLNERETFDEITRTYLWRDGDHCELSGSFDFAVHFDISRLPSAMAIREKVKVRERRIYLVDERRGESAYGTASFGL